MAKRTKVTDQLITRLTDEALRSVAAADDPAATKAARTAATKAAEAVKQLRKQQDAELRSAFQAARTLSPDAIDRVWALVSARRRDDCPGAVCGVGCGVGCAAGCALTGGLTVGFGAAGGTAGGAGTAIAIS